MKFEPLDKNGRTLFKAGIYDFMVMDANECVSSSGNEMIKLKLNIDDGYGNNNVIFDHLVGSSAHRCKEHIRDFIYSIGLEENYENGEISENQCHNKTGKCELMIEENEQYGNKNKVRKYISKNTPNIKDDDIPF